MNKFNELRFILIVSLLTLIVFVFSVQSSSIKTGIGFGRDTQAIVEVISETNNLDSLIAAYSKQNYDTHKQVIRDDLYMVTFSGIGSSDAFVEEFQNRLIGASIRQVGSFGSLAVLTTTENTVGIYFLLFVIVIIAYFSFRYNLMGWILALEIIFSISFSLYFINRQGYTFTYPLWFVMLLSFALLAYQRIMFMNDVADNLVRDKSDPIVKKRLILYLSHSLALLALGVAFAFSGYALVNLGLYLGCVAAVSFLFSLTRHYLIKASFKRYKAVLDRHFGEITRSDYARSAGYKSINRGILIVAISCFALMVIVGGSSGLAFERNSDFSDEKLMIVGINDPVSYLEMQATFSRVGIFDKQIDYQISEQRTTWIRFDGTVSYQDLTSAQADLALKLEADVFLFSYEGYDDPFSSQEFYLILALSVVLSWLMVKVSHNWKKSLIAPVMSVLSLAIFIFFALVIRLVVGIEMILLMWSLPVLVGAFISTQSRTQTTVRTALINESFYCALGINLRLLLIATLPILVITPTVKTQNMIIISVVAIVSVLYAMIFARFFFSVFRKWIKA